MINPFFHNIRAQILSELNQAEKEIVVAIYWFTNHELFDKLCEKKENGIKVSLIVHNDFINNRENGLNFQKFIDLGGELYFSDSDNPMHNKFCVIDNTVLINGSYNWTYFAESKNNENILLIKQENETISAFRKEFDSLKSGLELVNEVKKLTKFEIDEFNGLNSREYLANDIIYEAKATNRPEIVQEAFKISPENIKVQKEAIKLELYAKRKLKCSIGAGLKDNQYLVGVEKGTLLPVKITREVFTSADNQVSCKSIIYYGDKELANENKRMPNKGANGQIGGVIIRGLPKLPARKARMKLIFTIDLYAKLVVKFYSLDNGREDFYRVDIKNLVSELENE
ncbi:hypothetical protein BST97_05010 [Nonlabens spongiae]|uniref:phospholipase D n=1 Tax=Nonlabens spongiae TaxID=331648 RepID=A0A1W6MIH4_9FLAO|nr:MULTISPECIES: phospholipase D-like domain-containing protein [Flavobacteriaceae]ARN77392.1 hypothetical protein BST97_05010 [Nonlabens spongiae]